MSLRPFLAGLLFILFLAAPSAGDERSTERFRYSCSNSLGRRDITLFGNGTVRLRQGPWEDQQMFLTELGPEDLQAQLRALREIYDQREIQSVDLTDQPVSGEWVERCSIRLELPDRPVSKVTFGKLEIPPLQVSRWIHVAERLAEVTRPLDLAERLPSGYEPRVGDLLRDANGKRFEVIGKTSDGFGVELEDKQAPLRVFYRLEDLKNVFVGVERRGQR